MEKEKGPRVSVKAMIVKDGKMLLIKKTDEQGEYFIFPGGGQHHGEPVSSALMREVREETGFAVEVGDIVFVRDYIGANHEFRERSGHFHQIELYLSAKLLAHGHGTADLPDSDQVGIEWLPLEKIKESRVYPLSLRANFAEMKLPKIYAGDVN